MATCRTLEPVSQVLERARHRRLRKYSDSRRKGKGTSLEVAEKLDFVSGHRFSDAASRVLSIAPLGAEVSISIFSATSSGVPPEATRDKGFSVCVRAGFWPNWWDKILAPEGRLTIARRFSAGKSGVERFKSRRDD